MELPWSRLRVVLFCLALRMIQLGSFANRTEYSRPLSVNIGALVANGSRIGNIALKAIEIAIDDVNKDENVLNGTHLNITMLDSNCSSVQGASAAMDLLKGEVLAIVGPQTSAASRFVAELGNTLQVPFISFAATDPNLSASEYSYFVRLAHSDAMQMQAIASLVGYFGWKEVVAIYQDDNYGINGISALSDALQSFRIKIIYKAALAPGMNSSALRSFLAQLGDLESRVFIVHTPSQVGISIFSEANDLGLVTDEFVWIATEWLSSYLNTEKVNSDTFKSIQGVIGTHLFVPESEEYKKFKHKWDQRYGNLQRHESEISVFGLYAYDTIWLLARAIDASLSIHQNFTFQNSNVFATDLPLRHFEQGSEFLQEILKSKFNGTSGPIQIDAHGDLMNTAFEIINIVGSGYRPIGYWKNDTGLQTKSPSIGIRDSSVNMQKLLDVVWPGNGKQVPRGWVFPTSGKQLRVGVPIKEGFKEFVTVEGIGANQTAKGFCVDVFEAAIKSLPYPVPYTIIPFGSGESTPSYNDFVDQLAFKQFDAVVGDISITTNRSIAVDFTQPFVETGLVVVVPLKEDSSSNGWAFVRPFSIYMWITTGGFFIFVGFVVCLLEQRKNPHFQGERRKQFGSILWFSFSTLFNNQNDTHTPMGRVVVIVWLFVVLILTSSYTASLSSILTVQRLSPTIQGIHSLQTSTVPIGYQSGSFVKDYLTRELKIDQKRLVPLNSPENYAKSLSQGPKVGVGAIIDELPYVESFLATHCDLTIAGQTFTNGGWGFCLLAASKLAANKIILKSYFLAFEQAFPKDSQLAVDMSTAVLSLAEGGDLQKIHDKWLPPRTDCKNQNENSSQLDVSSFWGLFLITGLVSGAALSLSMIRMFWQIASGSGGSCNSRNLLRRGIIWFKPFGSKGKSETEEGKLGTGSCQTTSAVLRNNASCNRVHDLPIEFPPAAALSSL
eukprot:Gb_18838 [translate_table: standard]